MVEMECLAHRGLWNEPAEKNSLVAFQRALQAGFGIETDLRDHAGTVVISHDPPGGGCEPELTFEEFLQIYCDSGATGTLALNIKADGLYADVFRLLQAFAIQSYFVFDMSIPDMLGYLKLGMNCFSRQSEFETPSFIKQKAGFSETRPTFPHATGIWLDSFSSIWYSTDLVRDHLDSGLDVCLVSPELHGRDPYPWWDELRKFRETVQPDNNEAFGKLMLCTDFPNHF